MNSVAAKVYSETCVFQSVKLHSRDYCSGGVSPKGFLLLSFSVTFFFQVMALRGRLSATLDKP